MKIPYGLIGTFSSLLYTSVVSQEYVPATYQYCNGRGMFNSTDFTCNCNSGWQAVDCSRRICPEGIAWAGYPTATDTVHSVVECSNAGTCNYETGLCSCRNGFEGRACERLSCPRDAHGRVCSGRGECLTMQEAASRFDGYQLTRIQDYSQNWDATVIQGCVCHWGFFGYDCSQRQCPTGDNFMTVGQKNEKMKLQCNATGGSFYIQFRGHTTETLPYNAGFGYLEHALEALDSISDVRVSVNSGYQVCNDFGPITTIEFLQDFGNLPPARAVSVDLDGVAQFITQQTLTCQNCTTGCSGGVFLTYDGDTTDMIKHDATVDDIISKLQELGSLTSESDHGTISLSVNFTSSNDSYVGPGETMCTAGYDTKTIITMKSDFGNLYDFEIVNSIYRAGEVHGLELDTPSGTKEDVWCSGYGYCNSSYGICECYLNASVYVDYYTTYDNETYNATVEYTVSWNNLTYENTSEATRIIDINTPLFWDNRYGSSDGYGNQGTRGDCGYQMIEPLGCPGRYDSDEETFYECNEQGTCITDTFTCDCYDGWSGPDCTHRSCPVGKAWFDEAHKPNAAHKEVECSNMGNCNHDTGVCECREGFTGRACNRMTCVSQCNGHGSCQPLWMLANLAIDPGTGDPLRITYGVPAGVNPNTWDWDMIYQCHCDTPSYFHPYNGPKAYIHGIYVDNPHLGGYHGWDCSRRYCPYGDDPMTEGVYEIQSIKCNSTLGNFSLTFRGKTTEEVIGHNSTITEVKTALENITTIGNVSVSMQHGNTSCNDVTDDAFHVTFLKELGDVPLMTSSIDELVIEEFQKGTKEFVECSNRGFCNEETGLCECLHPYVSSDGDGNYGILDNCGRKSELIDSV